MKTPKRNKGNGYEAECCPFEGPNQTAFEHARWKRKNRVRQLKRSLERYKKGTMLYDHFDLYLAYRWLQRLKKPGKAADSKSWKNYIHHLGAIRGVLVYARQEAEKALQKALERELGKEQGC